MLDDFLAIQDLEVNDFQTFHFHVHPEHRYPQHLRLALQSAVPLESKEGFHLPQALTHSPNFIGTQAFYFIVI